MAAIAVALSIKRRHYSTVKLEQKSSAICASADRAPGLRGRKLRRFWSGVMRAVRVARILKTARYACARCNMRNLISTAEKSGDLFGKMPIPWDGSVVKRRLPPELTAARALCRQLRRKQAPRDKQRIAHLICLNLVSILRHTS
jgi:hypothetical protein